MTTRIDAITTERAERKFEQIGRGINEYKQSIQTMSKNKPEDARAQYDRLSVKFKEFDKSFAQLQQFWRQPGEEQKQEQEAQLGQDLSGKVL